ncbi:MAG: Bacterial type secretion system protein domain protein [Marmoricola sp.]|nr:Bacterial type secretion system protein domain protein [Marmoricola sp.]
MGAVLGLVVGLGLVLIGSAFVLPRRRRPVEAAGRTAARLAEAGLAGWGVSSVWAGATGLGLAAVLAVQLLSRTLPVALVFGVIGGYLPFAVINGRARRRRREFAEVWPEAVDQLASGVRAGLGLAEALGGLATRGPDPLRPAFAAFALDHQVSGRLTESLDRLKQELADPVGDRVVEALRIAREVGGGDLGRLLRNLSQFLREDARARAELESRQAWTINSARLAVSAPWLVLLLLSFQHEVIGRYASPVGVLVLTGGGSTCVAAYWLMMRIGRLPVERRILG